MKIKEFEKQYNCSKINDNVIITFHYIDDAKKGVKTEGKMEDCDSTNKCGVKNNSGSFEWGNYRIFQKLFSEIS